MRQQEGYIELDGQAVDKAARKAYEIEKVKDDEYNRVVDERNKELALERGYFRSEQAQLHFQHAYEDCKYKKRVEYTHRGWLFDSVSVKYLETADEEKMLAKLINYNKYWEDKFIYGVISDYKRYGKFFVSTLFSDIYRYQHHSYQAEYYKQFFDLKGKVMLTLEQYSKLKEYMKDE